MLSSNQILDKMQYILGTLKDGQNGYQEAAENATNPQLKALLLELGQGRAQMASQIEQHITQLGGTPRQGGSAGAALHRTWINIKDALTGRDDQAVISECERGDKAAVDNYEDVLKEDLPSDVKNVIQEQYQQVVAGRERMTQLKNSMGVSR